MISLNFRVHQDAHTWISFYFIVDNVVKNGTFNTLKTKVNSLEKKVSDATILIHINQYNTDKIIGDVDKKITKYHWFSD